MPMNRSSGADAVWGRVLGQGGAIIAIAVIVGLLVNQVHPGKLPLVGDWSPKAQLNTDSGINLEISLEDTEALFFAGIALLLDARPPDQYAAGHTQGALNLPWDAFETTFPQVMAGVPHDTSIVTYCDGETCGLSKDLAFALLQEGYFNVRVLVNGWTLWQQNYLPVATGGGNP